MTTESQNKSMFRDINADDDDPEVTEIESICMNCEEQVVLSYSDVFVFGQYVLKLTPGQ